MIEPNRPWTVAPHAPLEQIDENLWILEGTFPENKVIVRTMHVLKRSDGTLLFHNAVTMNEETEQQLRALGKPAVLVVPSPVFGMDGTVSGPPSVPGPLPVPVALPVWPAPSLVTGGPFFLAQPVEARVRAMQTVSSVSRVFFIDGQVGLRVTAWVAIF